MIELKKKKIALDESETISFFSKEWKQAQKCNKCFTAALFSFEKLSLNLAKLGFKKQLNHNSLIFPPCIWSFLFSSDKVLC